MTRSVSTDLPVAGPVAGALLSRRALLRSSGVAAALGAVGGVSACGGETPLASRLLVGGGAPDGTLVKVARLLARELVSRGIAGSAPVSLTEGSIENLRLLRSGEVQLAPALADAAATSVGANGADVVAVARIFQHTLHCLVRADSPFEEVADLRGQRIAIGPVGSGTAASAERVLRIAGVVEGQGGGAWERVSPADAVISLAGGATDAMLWWGGRPAQEIAAIAAVRPLRPLDLGGLVTPANQLAGGVYQTVRIPTEDYGAPEVRTLGTDALLLCRRELDDDLVAAVVDVAASSGTRLVPQPADGVRYWETAALLDTGPVPLHPAALVRYRERHG